MCWFAGFSYKDISLLKNIWKTLYPRAIDKEHFYTEEGLSFYHAHLQISDLDKDTSQPLSRDNIVIGLVWEIYNKKKLLEISGIQESEENFTELESLFFAYTVLGPDFVNYVNGEFAIFIYDKNKKEYFLFRDRWGVKNSYYKVEDNSLFFASEIKSLISGTPVLNKEAFIEYMTFQFSISPNTIVEWIKTLRPGTFLKFHNGDISLYDFQPYQYTEKFDIIKTIENSVIRRIPTFQDRLFISLSGGPDSNLILFFLKKHYIWEIIAYSFLTDKNAQEIEIAVKNAKIHNIKHLIIDMNNYVFDNLEEDLYLHEWIVNLPNLGKIIKEKYPEYKSIKVEFGGDGKEELILWNNHYPYNQIIGRYKYFRSKWLIKEFSITQEFLNKEMFDFNLQMIDKLTLRNGIERRLPFTDYEMLKFFKYSTYRGEAEKFLSNKWLSVVSGEFGYDLGIKFENLYDTALVRNKNLLFKELSSNTIRGI